MPQSPIAVAITNQQRRLPVDRPLLRKAVRAALGPSPFTSCQISLAVVGDETMARINEEYLGHVGPTDVLSFVLEEADGHLEGELIVDAEVALRVAPEYQWSAAEELLLYVVHGALHLAGYDDTTAAQRAKMRARERHVLESLGLSAESCHGGSR
jgi:probable rRNA maturation factor